VKLSKADRPGKTDRTARLLKVEHLLYQNPSGLNVEQISSRCEVSKRTSYRDLRALEIELGVPIWEEGTKRGITEGYLLPPIHFTLPEALNVFLAARLMLSYTHRDDTNVASTFTKLNSIVPAPLRDQIQKTMEWMRKQPKDDRYLRTIAALAEAWISRQQIKIIYKALDAKKTTERIIEPYFIEPAAAGHSSYVIAYCHRAHKIRTFKIERIESIGPPLEHYVIPPTFDANAFLGSSWGITVQHPSQAVERQKDGSVIMTLRVTVTDELRFWILSWGEKVEVLQPLKLRELVARTGQAIVDVYKKE